MQAFILAGGLGTRLRPLTQKVPKCLVPVAGRPFLEHLITRLTARGINHFVIGIGYRGDQIKSYLGDGSQWNCEIRYSEEKPPRGTGGALDQAKDLLKDEFLFLNGDNLVELDIARYLKHFRSHPDWVGAMCVYPDLEGRFRKNIFWSGRKPIIESYEYAKPEGKNFVDIGVKLFRKSVLSYLPRRNRFSLEKAVLPRLAREGKLGAFQIENYPIEIGNPLQLEEAEKILSA